MSCLIALFILLHKSVKKMTQSISFIRNCKLHIILLLIICCCSSKNDSVIANKNEPFISAAISASEMLKTHMRQFDIPGMQVAVSSGGQLVWSESFGYADLERKIPVNNTTEFRLGSVSKSLTGAAVALLLQQGKFTLESEVYQLVPTFPKKPWPITIGQLAGHTSGIRHYNSDDEVNNTKHYETVSEALNQFSNDTLLFAPGTQVEYSSFGYTLLSAAIESVSNSPFPEYMKNCIFVPLGMTHTSMDYTDRDIPERSKFYVLNDDDMRVEAPFVDNSNKWAAGGMISTAEDLARFGNALLDNSLVRADINDLLFKSMKTKNGVETGYGIGWQIKMDGQGRKVVFSDGSMPSARAVLLLYPAEKLVVSLLMNTGKSIFFNKEEAMMLANLFLQPTGFNPSETERRNAVGKYSYSTTMEDEAINGVISITEENGRLKGTMTIPNQFFKERVIPVPSVRVVGDQIDIIGVPGNWISMSFISSGNESQGIWRFGPIKGDMECRHYK